MPVTTSVAESRERAALHASGAALFAIRETAAGDAIGFVGFGGDLHATHQAGFGYLLHKAFWGRGYVVEAAREVLAYGFTKLGVPAAELWIYDGNDQSRRVAEKLGATYRGANVGFNLLKGPRVTHVYEVRAPGATLPPDVLRVVPSLSVADLNAGVAWYRDALGFTLEWVTPTSASLVSPGWLPLAATIRLYAGDAAPSRLTFQVADGIDEIAAGLGVTPEDHPWGLRDFSVTDPWGNVLTYETPTAR
jgi:catechol 2,3-dioxygenase-like lactoylglutathione lyase family enzyme